MQQAVLGPQLLHSKEEIRQLVVFLLFVFYLTQAISFHLLRIVLFFHRQVHYAYVVNVQPL